MQYVRFGRSSLKVSRLGLGAMGFGDASWRRWVLDATASRPILARAVERGITFVDTCDFYSDGASERILGEVLWDLVPRDAIVLATKAGNPMGKGPNDRGFSRKHLFSAVDASLKRLRTEYIDLYQTHVWDAATDLDEMVEAFTDLRRAGKVLYVGATTMPAWTFATCVERARATGQTAFASMQCEYNLCHREAERELIPYCGAAGLACTPFSPFARGFLCADRREPGNATARHESDDYTLKHYHRPADYAVQEAVDAVARGRGVSRAQVALAWVLRQPCVTAPLFGATRVEQVDEAVAALELDLEDAEVARLEAAYAPRPTRAGGH